MRIALFGPSSSESAIATVTRHLVAALREIDGIEVEHWAHDGSQAPPGGAPDVDFGADPAALDRLGDRDVAVYQIGNHDIFHGPIVDVAQHRPGVVILHDRSLMHFFGARHVAAGDREGLLRRLGELYGPRGRRVGKAFFGASSWAESEDIIRFGLMEDALAGHFGAVAHSRAHAEEMRARWHGPVGELFLPTFPPHLAEPPVPPPARAPGDRVTLVTAGDVNRNKHAERIVQVLASDPALAQRVRYIVVGRIYEQDAYARELAGEIAAAGLAGSVLLLGRQPSATYARLLADADVFINLRFPALEGGSATLTHALASGRPVVGYDTGAYSDVPRDAMVHVPVGDLPALRRALRRLVEDPDRRAAIGARGRAYAETLTFDRYARELVAFLERARAGAPRLALTDAAARQLAALGVPVEDDVFDRVAELVDGLMPASPVA